MKERTPGEREMEEREIGRTGHVQVDPKLGELEANTVASIENRKGQPERYGSIKREVYITGTEKQLCSDRGRERYRTA